MDSVVVLGKEVRKRDKSVMIPRSELGRLRALGVPFTHTGIQEGSSKKTPTSFWLRR